MIDSLPAAASRCHGLGESGGILEDETARRDCLTPFQPAGLLFAAQSAVALVDQQQVVVAELGDGHRVLAPDFAQLGDLDDVHPPKVR